MKLLELHLKPSKAKELHCQLSVLRNEWQCAVLAHYSVKEYLVSDRIQHGQAAQYSMQGETCHSILARGCLGYLEQFQDSGSMANETLTEFQLALYAAHYWMSHARKAGDQIDKLLQAVKSLLRIDNPAYGNWLRFWDPDYPWMGPNLSTAHEHIVPPLYFAIYSDINEVVKLLLDGGADVNAQSENYFGTAIQLASCRGNQEIVETLLDAGADANARGGFYGNALLAATTEGHEQVVRVLLNAGAADANTLSQPVEDALFDAVSGGHEQIVRMLPQDGTTIELQNRFGRTAPSLAAFLGHQSILKLLIAVSNPSPNSRDYYGRTLIWWAAAGGREDNVKLLLSQYHSDPSIADVFGRTPLSMATKKGNDAVIKILAREPGVENMAHGEEGTSIVPRGDHLRSGYLECDVCTLHVPIQKFHYHCWICEHGNFDICMECKAMGASCLDSTHVLESRGTDSNDWSEGET